MKNFENRSIFYKDMDKTLWLFGGHPVDSVMNNARLNVIVLQSNSRKVLLTRSLPPTSSEQV